MELEDQNQEGIQTIPADMPWRVMENLHSRVKVCLQRSGGHL